MPATTGPTIGDASSALTIDHTSCRRQEILIPRPARAVRPQVAQHARTPAPGLFANGEDAGSNSIQQKQGAGHGASLRAPSQNQIRRPKNERPCMSLAKAHISHQKLPEDRTCEYQPFVQNRPRRDAGSWRPVQRERERSEELKAAERPQADPHGRCGRPDHCRPRRRSPSHSGTLSETSPRRLGGTECGTPSRETAPVGQMRERRVTHTTLSRVACRVSRVA